MGVAGRVYKSGVRLRSCGLAVFFRVFGGGRAGLPVRG